MNGEETRFKIGNSAAEKWTLEDAEKSFNEMLEFTISNDDVVSVQQAYIDFKMPCVTYYYLLKKFPELEHIKKGINDVIISRVNKGAINNDLNPTACIWRMKQLGERDKQEVESTTVNYNAEVTREEAKNISDALEDEC